MEKEKDLQEGSGGQWLCKMNNINKNYSFVLKGNNLDNSKIGLKENKVNNYPGHIGKEIYYTETNKLLFLKKLQQD